MLCCFGTRHRRYELLRGHGREIGPSVAIPRGALYDRGSAEAALMLLDLVPQFLCKSGPDSGQFE
jgi:hypothetical protein